MEGKPMSETAERIIQVVEKGVETLVKKAWSIMDAASEKVMPSQYLSDRAIRSIQGKEENNAHQLRAD